MTALRTAAILFLFALVCACPVAAPLSAATITWDNGGVSQDWTDDGAGGNWSGDPAPGPGDNALFDENTDGGASGTTTNVVDTNFTIANLDYAVSASGAGTFFHTTEIAASTTLLATAGLDVLPATIDSNETLDVTIRGGAGSALQVGNVGGSTADIRIARNQLGTLDTITGNLDLSGLETFVAHLDDFEISVGVRPADAIVTLAEDNSITANSLVMGIGTGNNSNTPSELLLGETNTINANQLFIARTKSRATVEFQTGLVAPDVTIRGKAGGSSRADLEIGVQTGSTGSTGIGIVDFSGGTVDALLDNVIVGGSNNTGGGGTAQGTLTLDDGTIDANTITVGQNLSTNRTITGTLNILGGEVTVGTLTLAEEPNSGNAIGIVNLSGGSLRATTITEAGGSRSFNFTGGTLSADTVEFGFTQAGGELSPGQSIGATEIVGGYTLDDGQILLEINGLDRGDFTLNDGIGYDTVTVDGTATLSSTIKLKSIDGFQLQQGTTLDLLAADTISITPGFDLDISEFDIDPLVLAMGQTGFNIVTENGLQILRLGIGVPEPSSMSLAGLGCLAVVGQARRRKRHARRN